MVLVVKRKKKKKTQLACQSGDARDMSLIPGLERSHGEGHSNALQYSCLENPMRILVGTAHRVTDTTEAT